jgi:hypothetical protein
MLIHRPASADHHMAQADRDPEDEQIVREGRIDWAVVHLGDGPHVVPLDDLRLHEEAGCWCRPTEDEGITIHNAMDQREQFQAGAPPQ